ncbi:MAG: acyl-CoA dehydrogenase family protein [Firmicutes bacterium]|nr:acyl-CoA dehydrogenase family protein [Bacillota bacterium]
MQDVQATKRGGGFMLGSPPASEVFTPEDLSSEQRLIGETASGFARDEVLPLLDKLESQEHEHSVALVRRAGELGLLAADIPEEFGGLGLPITSSTLITEAIGQSGSFGITFGAHTGIGTLPIVFFGNEDQKRRYLPKLATGEWIAAYALTEPDAGSDALGGKTTAALAPGGRQYVLRGQKQWITNAAFADVFIVYAKVDGRMTAFIVRRDAPGLSVGPEVKKMGIKGSSTCAVYLNEVPVPAEDVLGEVGRGHIIAFNILNIGRWKLAAGALGGCKAVLAASSRYAQQRQQFGRPLASFPLIQQKLAAMAVRTYVLESMVYRTAGQLEEAVHALDLTGDAGQEAARAIGEYAVEASINKVFGSEVLDFVADEGVQIHGGYGYMQEYMVERAYRDSRINRIFEGTNEINRLLIPGTLLRRTMKGELPLMEALQDLQKELVQFAPALGETAAASDDPLAKERRLVDGLRKLTLMVAGQAVQKHMDNIEKEQELLAAAADLSIALYGAESAVLRAEKAGYPEGLVDMTRLFVHDALDEADATARRALAALEEGDALRAQLGVARRLTRRDPINAVALGRAIAARVLEAEGYPV